MNLRYLFRGWNKSNKHDKLNALKYFLTKNEALISHRMCDQILFVLWNNLDEDE